MNSTAPIQIVAEPSEFVSILWSTGLTVSGLWLTGKLNSIPPAIHAPRSAISAGLITLGR